MISKTINLLALCALVFLTACNSNFTSETKVNRKHSESIELEEHKQIKKVLAQNDDSLIYGELLKLEALFNQNYSDSSYLGFFYRKGDCIISLAELKKWNFHSGYSVKLYNDSNSEMIGQLRDLDNYYEDVTMITYGSIAYSLHIFFKKSSTKGFENLHGMTKTIASAGCSSGIHTLEEYQKNILRTH